MRSAGWLTKARIAEVARYCAVGLAVFGLDEGSLIFLHDYSSMPLWLDTAIAYAIASLVNFIASRQWVFEKATQGAGPGKALVRYVIVIFISLLATAAIVPGLSAVGVDYRIGKIFASGVVGVGNYFAFPLWVFKK